MRTQQRATHHTATYQTAGTGRTLVTGWFSFPDGEATAGDVLALQEMAGALEAAGVAFDVAWSPAWRGCDGGLRPPDDNPAVDMTRVDPADYDDLVFVCGPAHGAQVRALHRRFAHCRRTAVGVSVIDPDDPAVTGFTEVVARDAPGSAGCLDLSARAPVDGIPLVGVALTTGQGEYGGRRRHAEVAEKVLGWLAGVRAARVPVETRLDPADWRLARTPEEVAALVGRLDVLVTDRLHGMVLALRCGVPVIAVDPVAGGAKVTAQARAWGWPAVVAADRVDAEVLGRWWAWCRSAEGRRVVLERRHPPGGGSDAVAVARRLAARRREGTSEALRG